jgi:hypothetical protein
MLESLLPGMAVLARQESVSGIVWGTSSMQPLNRRQFLETSLLAGGALLLPAGSAFSAVMPGVETVVAPSITGDERSGQPDIWALEVRYKPLRMVHVGKGSEQELVWYLAYRIVVRPNSGVPEGDTGRPVFVPEMTLTTEDTKQPKVYPDQILPAAQAAIVKRERHKYQHAVEIVAPLPPVTPTAEKSLKTLDGLAMWKGIDPNTDFFMVSMSGFSNGYKVTKGDDDTETITRRTLVQRFWRPSDRFDQYEAEVRLKDDPAWIYR